MEHSPVVEALLAVLPWLWLIVAGAIALVLVSTVFELDIFRILRSKGSSVAAKFSRGNAVIGYKAARLHRNGFIGVSGGGSYGFVAEGKLDPGFHCFKDISTFERSSYSRSGSVILEVLIYGDVVEYDDGYIGSNQRVLQVIPNGRGSGHCYSCERYGIDLYFDRARDPGYYGRFGGQNAVFICTPCMKLAKFTGAFKRNRIRNRFVPLESYLEEMSRESGNGLPVRYVRDFSRIEPTVIRAESSAR